MRDNEVLEELISAHGQNDYVYIEAQHVQVGMLAYHPAAGSKTVSAWKRVVRVERIYKGVNLHYEDGAQMQRDLDRPILVNASDLPTAFALKRYDVPYQSLGHSSLRAMREKTGA